MIERKAGFKFERISPPQQADLAAASTAEAAAAVRAVNPAAARLFRKAAEELLAADEDGKAPDPADVLSAALAKIAGHTEARTGYSPRERARLFGAGAALLLGGLRGVT